MTDPLLASLREEGALAGLDLPGGGLSAEPLKGHASRRRFLRLSQPGGNSWVLVVYPHEEADDIERYVRVGNWLQAAAVAVPRVLARGERSLLVSDAGTRRLDHDGVDRSRRQRAYTQALADTLRIHRRGRRMPAPNPGWALDAERLAHELGFFERHALFGWLEVRDGRPARERFYERLVGAVAALPTAQCHRDFHSRNLMLDGDRLVVVDFQDQMEGPVFYDIASLVLDDYRGVEESTRGRLLHEYWSDVRPRSGVAPEARLPQPGEGLPAIARQAFSLVALQRNLKALGTFGCQVHDRGNGDFARFAPRTWAHARRRLALLGWSDVPELTVPLERAFG